MEMTCEGCSNAAKRVLAKIGGEFLMSRSGLSRHATKIILLQKKPTV